MIHIGRIDIPTGDLAIGIHPKRKGALERAGARARNIVTRDRPIRRQDETMT